MSAKTVLSQAVRLRRALHSRAESAFCEWQTFHYLKELFKGQPVTVRFIPKQTVIKHKDLIPADLICADEQAPIPGMIVTLKIHDKDENHPYHAAIRCDLDGLPIEESSSPQHLPLQLNFRAENGCMHACGHDGHMAIAVCSFLHFIRHREELAHSPYNCLSLICQPAEEGCRGALMIKDAGFLDDIDELWCFHLGMGLGSGIIAPNPYGFLATEKFNLSFYGQKAHAGHPELGVNALLPLCHTIEKALCLTDSTKQRYVNFSNVHCEGARNIIPDLASCEGELRAGTGDSLQHLKQQLFDIIADTRAEKFSAQSSQGTLRYRYTVKGQAGPVKQSADLVLRATQTAQSLGLKCSDFDFKASEDASLLIDYVQKRGGRGCYIVIGADIRAPHHNPLFDFDERALEYGTRLLISLFNVTN
ncbi:MAG: amidohydrolase [Succinivibrio sp.]|nr:amidohydrolase [Succinivibrio sp.]